MKHFYCTPQHTHYLIIFFYSLQKSVFALNLFPSPLESKVRVHFWTRGIKYQGGVLQICTCENCVTFHFIFSIYYEMNVHVHFENSQIQVLMEAAIEVLLDSAIEVLVNAANEVLMDAAIEAMMDSAFIHISQNRN